MHEPGRAEGRGEQPRPQPQGALDREERRRIVKLTAGGLLLIFFIIFIIQNSRRVPVDFVFVTKQIRLVWVFLACALVGALVAYLIGRPRRRAMKRLIEQLEKERKKDD